MPTPLLSTGLPLAIEWSIPTILLLILLLIVFIGLVIFLKFFKLWVQAYFSNARISIFELVGMWLRKVNATAIVQSKIALVQANIPQVVGGDVVTQHGQRTHTFQRAFAC